MIVLPGVQVPAIYIKTPVFQLRWHMTHFLVDAEFDFTCSVIDVLFHTSRDPQRQLTSLSYNTNTTCILHKSPRVTASSIHYDFMSARLQDLD